MSIRFINKNNPNESKTIKLAQNCKINDIKPNSIYDEAPYNLKTNQYKRITMGETQYKILTSLAKGMHYDFCDAWDNDKVLSEDDLAMAYERFQKGENVFGIDIKSFKYSKKFGKAEIIAQNGEILNIDIETEYERKTKDIKILNEDYWQNNKQESFFDWKKNDSFNKFLHAIGNRESSNDYTRVNCLGYLGRFQMGEMALADTKFYNKDNTSKHDWIGTWGQKAERYDVKSKKDFLENENAQNHAMFCYLKKQWEYIKNYKLDSIIGHKINGNEITTSGLLAAAHLVGIGSVKKYIETNGAVVAKDKYGTSLEEYLTKFGGFDIGFITGNK